jgi:two-component system LytT family response regulator
VIIVDDEPLARRGIRQQLERHPEYRVVAEAADAQEAIQRIREFAPDLVFLDISMPLGNGFDVVELIGSNNMPSFIFVTAYDQHALKAFDVNAVDYLLKPIDPERFDEALRRSESRRANERGEDINRRLGQVLNLLERRMSDTADVEVQRISIREGGKVNLVDVDQIDCIQAEGNYLILSIKGVQHRVRETMQEFLARTNAPLFVRVHRSVSVNRRAVTGIEPFGKGTYVLVLRDGGRVMSSYSYRDNVLALMRPVGG